MGSTRSDWEMQFLLPSATELQRASQVGLGGFSSVYPQATTVAVASPGRVRLWAWVALGAIFGAFWTSRCFSAPSNIVIAEVSFTALVGWLTVLSILLAVRPMQSSGERACLALLLGRYGFGVIAILFCAGWALANLAAGLCGESSAGTAGASMALVRWLPLPALCAGWFAAGAMFAQLVAEAGASHRELISLKFCSLVRSRARGRSALTSKVSDTRIQAVVAGMVRSIEDAIEQESVDDARQSARVVLSVIPELIWLTPVEQLGWDYSFNNRRSPADAKDGVSATQPVIVDLRLAAAVTRIVAAPHLPPVASLLLDLRHIWLSATFAAIRIGRPGIVSGSCAVAFLAYRDANVSFRQRILHEFVDAATEFMLIVRSDRPGTMGLSTSACRRPIVALFAHLSRLAAQRGEWINFKHFARPLAEGSRGGRGDSVNEQHRALCGLALSDLAGWLASEAAADVADRAQGFQVLRDLLHQEQSMVDFTSCFAGAATAPDDWNLGTEYWCTPTLERRGRFGEASCTFIVGGFRAQGAAILQELHDFGKQSPGLGADEIATQREYASRVLAELAGHSS